MDADLISLTLLVSAIAMYQFFMRRKLNLIMMNKVSKDFEGALKPVGKE